MMTQRFEVGQRVEWDAASDWSAGSGVVEEVHDNACSVLVRPGVCEVIANCQLRLVHPARFEKGQRWTSRAEGGYGHETDEIGCRFDEEKYDVSGLSFYPVLVHPAPYVPRVGDEVECVRKLFNDAIEEYVGRRFTVESVEGGWARLVGGGVSVVLAPGEHDAVRLVSRPDAAVAEEPPPVDETCPECGAVGLHACMTREPEPRVHNGTCPRGHAAYVGLGAAQCETCDAIAEVERDEPDTVEDVPIVFGALARVIERGFRVPCHGVSATREGAIALWRARLVKVLHEDGLARAALLRGGR